MSDIATVLRGNRKAVILIVTGTAVLALYLSFRLADTVDGAADEVEQTVRSVRNKVLTSGILAAVILVASFLLGAPAWLAFAATGTYLTVSAAGKTLSALSGKLPGGSGGTNVTEVARLICEQHNGPQAVLEAGTTSVVACRDGTTFRVS